MPANPARVKPWWYRSMTPDFAAEHYAFPATPDTGDEHQAQDGSIWEFNATGPRNCWELMNYSTKCVCIDCAAFVDPAKLGEYCTECLLIGCDKSVRLPD
jgi:hypothetical protein